MAMLPGQWKIHKRQSAFQTTEAGTQNQCQHQHQSAGKWFRYKVEDKADTPDLGGEMMGL
jgi:hypothetical protein